MAVAVFPRSAARAAALDIYSSSSSAFPGDLIGCGQVYCVAFGDEVLSLADGPGLDDVFVARAGNFSRGRRLREKFPVSQLEEGELMTLKISAATGRDLLAARYSKHYVYIY